MVNNSNILYIPNCLYCGKPVTNYICGCPKSKLAFKSKRKTIIKLKCVTDYVTTSLDSKSYRRGKLTLEEKERR